MHVVPRRSDAIGAISPGCEGFVLGCGGDGGLADREEFAADEPGYGGLRGALRDADGFGEVLIADADRRGAALLFACEPEIDEETGGAAIVTYEVAHEDVGDIGIEFEHGYTDG
jgi:hypothetical protein